MKEPSEIFKRAVLYQGGGGSIAINCEHCGRTHFADDERAGDWEEGELENLREKSRKDPDKYVAHGDDDMIRWGRLNGKQYVIDCQCNSGRPFENFIWNHRFIISEYLRNRVKEMQKSMNREHENIKQLPSEQKMRLT